MARWVQKEQLLITLTAIIHKFWSVDEMKEIFLVNCEGVKSFQCADYNTYYALAEILDNSIQANAKNIHVIGIQENEKVKKRSIKKLNEIIIYDDGTGMDQKTASICLQLGGGSYIGAKKNLGKFGMGLPQASGSQCMRTEVYSWQKVGEIYHTYLDYDELEKKDPPMLPKLRLLKRLPATMKKIVTTVIKNGNFDIFSEEHGTIIYWKNAHKLNHKTYPAFYRNFEEFIGRVYRYFLYKKKVNITLSGLDRIEKDCRAIEDKKLFFTRVNDPLFLMEKNNLIESYDSEYKNKATNKNWAEEIRSIENNGKKYDVRIKFSISNDKLRNDLKRKYGQEAGGTPLGKLYGRNMGISLLRAGRELKLADFGFVGDRSDPTQRWWGAEVEFQPNLDELFGVTFDKQEAKAFRCITKEEYQEDLSESGDESLSLMYEISQKIVNNLRDIKRELKKQTKDSRPGKKQKSKCKECGQISVVENKCTECGYILDYCPKHTDRRLDKDGNCPVCSMEPPVEESMCTKHSIPLVDGECKICKKERGPGKPIPADEEKRLKKYIEANFYNYKGNEYLLNEAIKYFQNSGRDHFILYASSDRNSFISFSTYGKITIISINTNHPFYENFMSEIIEDEERDLYELVPIHLLVGALVNAEQQDYENKEILDDFRGQFSVNLKKLMRTYKFPTY